MVQKAKNVKILVNMLLREMGVFIAHLATFDGERKPLAKSLDLFFLTIAQDLHKQGLSRKVAADMFEMTLRSYQRKVKRLQERTDEQEAYSIWKEVYERILGQGEAEREAILQSYKGDRVAIVRSVLKELVEVGLLEIDADEDERRTIYRPTQVMLEHEEESFDRLYWIVWLSVCRGQVLTYDELRAQMEPLGVDEEELDAILDMLCRQGRIQREEPDGPGGEVCFLSSICVIQPEQSLGWEASLYDHVRTVLSSITRKMRLMREGISTADLLGGSTYGFDLWEGHPHEQEVLSLLSKHREELTALREKTDRFNEEASGSAQRDDDEMYRVTFYFGQGLDERAEQALIHKARDARRGDEP